MIALITFDNIFFINARILDSNYNRDIEIISFKKVNSLGYKLWYNRYGNVSITRNQWLGKTTKRVRIKSWRPINVPQNAIIVLMIYEKIQQWSIQHASAPYREAMFIYKSITLIFPTRVINWKTLTTSLSWLYIYHQLGSKMHFQVPLNQPRYF